MFLLLIILLNFDYTLATLSLGQGEVSKNARSTKHSKTFTNLKSSVSSFRESVGAASFPMTVKSQSHISPAAVTEYPLFSFQEYYNSTCTDNGATQSPELVYGVGSPMCYVNTPYSSYKFVCLDMGDGTVEFASKYYASSGTCAGGSEYQLVYGPYPADTCMQDGLHYYQYKCEQKNINLQDQPWVAAGYGPGELILYFFDDQNAANNNDLNQVCNSAATANEFELLVDGCFTGEDSEDYKCVPESRRVAVTLFDSKDCSGAQVGNGMFGLRTCASDDDDYDDNPFDDPNQEDDAYASFNVECCSAAADVCFSTAAIEIQTPASSSSSSTHRAPQAMSISSAASADRGEYLNPRLLPRALAKQAKDVFAGGERSAVMGVMQAAAEHSTAVVQEPVPDASTIYSSFYYQIFDGGSQSTQFCTGTSGVLSSVVGTTRPCEVASAEYGGKGSMIGVCVDSGGDSNFVTLGYLVSSSTTDCSAPSYFSPLSNEYKCNSTSDVTTATSCSNTVVSVENAPWVPYGPGEIEMNYFDGDLLCVDEMLFQFLLIPDGCRDSVFSYTCDASSAMTLVNQYAADGCLDGIVESGHSGHRKCGITDDDYIDDIYDDVYIKIESAAQCCSSDVSACISASDTPAPSSSTSLSSGAIAGAVIGSLIGVGILVALGYFIFIKFMGPQKEKTVSSLSSQLYQSNENI